MPEDYKVQPGDCMSSIAYARGFFWATLWNLPENAALKAQRKDPNVLMTDDSVHIPDLTVKEEPRPTDKRHKFQLKGVPEKLHIRLLDYEDKPRPNLDYVLVIDGDARRGKTDSSGRITESIPPSAMSGKLTFAAPQHVDKTGRRIPAVPAQEVLILQLGNLNPVSEVSGLKARLANLGFYKGPINESLDAAAQAAIRNFQTTQRMTPTGVADDAMRQKLQDIHGH
jgi:hypothetical protein